MKTNNPLRIKRQQDAHEHTKLMKQNYNEEINFAIHHTHIYDENRIFDVQEKSKSNSIKVMDWTTSQAIIEMRKQYPDKSICALNFASFKNPGGGFYNGSFAQEEALCHDSFLYNVLCAFKDNYYQSNKKDLNHSLYYNRALYSQDIMFFDNLESYKVDILTCAAPNYREASRQGISLEENNRILKERSQYILDIASLEKVQVLILGAWGCGVFSQDPQTVASFYQELLMKYDFEEIIFAVPKGRNNNYDAFYNIFME